MEFYESLFVHRRLGQGKRTADIGGFIAKGKLVMEGRGCAVQEIGKLVLVQEKLLSNWLCWQ